mmetsp:Transcript_1304/g.2075  ORF Transcript_1304/g.2075 Transcript_1304/m.2075 type:complete len:368 (-) Transcript_1304:20-1123(-)
MSLWVDDQLPVRLADLDFHPNITKVLQNLARDHSSFPNIFFSGPPGCGKRTRVSTLLGELYHTDLTGRKKLRQEFKSLKINDSKTIEVSLLTSPYHVELNLAEVGPTNDRIVIMTLIKEMAQSTSIAQRIVVGEAESDVVRPPFKVFVLHQIELLSKGAQQALRRTMEKYVQSCRLILIASGGAGTGRIIAPIKSRCLEIRVASPCQEETEKIMRRTLEKNGENANNNTLIRKIHEQSNGDLRRALLLLESYWRNNQQEINIPWRIAIRNICEKIKKEQSPKQLSDIRTNIYDLLQSCVPGEVIIREVCLHFARCLCEQSDNSLRQFISAAAEYEHNLRIGSRALVHVEAFFATAMAIIKRNNLQFS